MRINLLKRFLHIGILVKMLLLGGIAFGQSADDSAFAVPDGKTRYTNLFELNHAPDLFRDIDTSLTGIWRKFNPAYLQNLGNIGSPAFPLVWQLPNTPGFRFGFHQWDFLRLTTQNLPFYNTQNPFTDLSYIQGSEQFYQIVNATHTQNILPTFNFALSLKREGSQGYYEEQNSRNGNFALNTWYRSPNRRYLVAASAIYNFFSFSESGGITGDTSFENSKISNRQRASLPVYLSGAKQTFDDYDYTIQQFLYFGGREQVNFARDTDTVAIMVLKPRFYITHKADFYKQKYNYRDEAPTIGFYPEILLDSSLTDDSYSYTNFSNLAGFGYIFGDSSNTRNLSVQAFAKYDLINTKVKTEKSTFGNTSIGFNGKKDGKLALDFSSEYTFQGYNSGNFFADAKVSSPFFPALKMSRIGAFGRLQNYSADFIESRYTSNHYDWRNDFKQVQSIFLGGHIYDDTVGLKLGLSYTAVNNFIYWGKDARPHQASTPLQYFQLRLARNFVVSKFHFDHNIIYQKQLQGNYIRIPDLVIRTSYYYQNRIFKHKPLFFQGGIDFNYNSSYTAYAYMPGTSRFYLQDSIQIGNYPVFDIFIAGQVKRFMVFFKLEHASEGLFGERFYSAAHYPIPPRTFRFGLKWRFYN